MEMVDKEMINVLGRLEPHDVRFYHAGWPTVYKLGLIYFWHRMMQKHGNSCIPCSAQDAGTRQFAGLPPLGGHGGGGGVAFLGDAHLDLCSHLLSSPSG